MTNSKSLIILFCFQAFLASISIPIGQSRTLFPNDDNLITQTCQRTYDPNVCVQNLKSDPRGSNADVKGLALIMTDAMKAHGNDVESKINELLKGSPSPGQRDSLHYCASLYAEILNQDIPNAVQALNSGDFNLAESKTTGSGIKSSRCEDSFYTTIPPAESPITDKNEAMFIVSEDSADIIKKLL